MHGEDTLVAFVVLILFGIGFAAVWVAVLAVLTYQRLKSLGERLDLLAGQWRELKDELRRRPVIPGAEAGERIPVPAALPATSAGPAPAMGAAAAPAPVPSVAAPIPPLPATPAAVRSVPRPPVPLPVPVTLPPRPLPPPVPRPAKVPGPFAASCQRLEAAALLALRRAWNWLIVGEEYRDPRRSLEYAVATTWGVRLAIALFVTGIAFGLRMSFKEGWIGPDGRIALGVLTGVALIAGGLRLLGKRYHILGQGLIGGGLATLYVTTFAAHHLYQRVNAWTAFGFMAVVTAAAGVISVAVSSLLIAVLGIIGGYLTPFVLQGSSAGYPAFFTYLLVLGFGILIVSHFRYWVLLNYLGMGFAYVHVLRTLHAGYEPADLWQVLPFLAGLFLLCTAVSVIYNVANRRRSTLIEVLGLVANSGVFFWIAQGLVRQSYGREQVAILTVALAALYVGIIYAFLVRRLPDRSLLLALLALAGFYVALTMPLLLSREWLTVSWAVQAFLMLWLSRRLGSRFLQALACVLYGVVVWRIFALDFRHAFPRLAGELPLSTYLRDLADRLVAFGVPIASLVGAWRLHARAPAPDDQAVVPREADTGALLRDSAGLAIFLAAAVLAGFVYLHFELNRMFGVLFDPFRLPALTLLWLVLALGLFVAACRLANASWLALAGWAALVVVLVKLIGIDLHAWDFRPGHMCFGTGYAWLQAAMRAVDFGAIVLFAAWAARQLGSRNRQGAAGMLVVALAVLFCYLTIEVNTMVRHYVPGLRSGGISIVWSLYALALVAVGIARGVRPARLAGLVLFAVVGLKVFFVDLSHLSPLFRMLALMVMALIAGAGVIIYLRNAEGFVRRDTEETGP